ncbi:hypothetical protein CNR22_24280 [Sphingobacteriaceae bacterium]|nr:hypothetical protein CNR22_00030 [Sphingobacteriaceae bacterium]PBQ34759.1 hypothetical protein CNR22_24280 [Sphingobacteriaceae bacterium]
MIRFQHEIVVYPNPTNGNVIVEVNLVSENQFEEIYTSIGQLVMSKTLSEAETKIDLKNLPNGIYTVIVRTQNKTLKATKVVRE